jgi:hypothetical protein
VYWWYDWGMSEVGSLLSQPGFYVPLMIWSIFWKGWALWKAAGKRHLVWFAILLTFNTMALLEIAYIFYLNRWDIDNGKILNYLETKIKRVKK